MTVGGIILISVLGGLTLAVIWFVIWYVIGELETQPMQDRADVESILDRLRRKLDDIDGMLR